MKSSSLVSRLATALIAVGSFLAAGSAAQAQQSGEVVSLRVESKRGMCLTLASDARMSDCSATERQKITLVRASGGTWNLRMGNRCVRPAGKNDPLVLGSCDGETARWTFNGHGQIKNARTGECMHVWAAGGDNPKVTTNKCQGQGNQKWARYKPIPAAGVPEAAHNAMITPKSVPGKCLDVESRLNSLITWDCHGQSNQRLSFTWGEQTQIRVKNGCLVPDDAHARKSTVSLQRCEQNRKTKIWIAGSDGSIRNVYGACLEVDGSGLKNGTRVITNTCSNKPNQRFYPR